MEVYSASILASIVLRIEFLHMTISPPDLWFPAPRAQPNYVVKDGDWMVCESMTKWNSDQTLILKYLTVLRFVSLCMYFGITDIVILPEFKWKL